MNFITNLFSRKTSKEIVLKQECIAQLPTGLTAKEKQLVFVKDSLKPFLKAKGYKTVGNKWWKIDEPFFNLIEPQNFSWNSRNSVDFCFNFTTGFTADAKNSTKPTIHDGFSYVRESYFGITKNDYWKGANSYHIDLTTDLNKFTERVLMDFTLLILPKLNSLTNVNAILSFYSDEFSEPRVKQSLALGRRSVRINN